MDNKQQQNIQYTILIKKSIFRFGLLVSLCCFAVNVQATASGQKEKKENIELISSESDNSFQRPLEGVEELPCFPGGLEGLMEWLSNNVRYPKAAQRQGFEGRVVVQFTVERDGSICDIEVVDSVSPDLDAEAVRAVRSMPKWTPGKMNGEPIPVQFSLPINFVLPDDDNEDDSFVPVIYDIVDEAPVFPGGQAGLNYWLSNNIRYPDMAWFNGDEGRVLVGFVVEKDGSVSDVDVWEGATPELDAEAVRVVKKMPNWTPGKVDGEPVRVMLTLPINFTLQSPDDSGNDLMMLYYRQINEADELERKGDAEASKGDIHDALAFYKLAYDSFPFDLSPIEKSEVLLQDDKEALTDLYSSGMERLLGEMSHSEDPEALLDLYYENVIYFLEGLSALDPSDLDLKLMLQSCYFNTQDFDEFIAVSEEIYPVLKKNSFDDETKQIFLSRYALVLGYSEDYKELIKKIAPYKDFLMKSSDLETSGFGIYMLGLAYKETGKKKEAAKMKDWLLKNAPEVYQAFSEEFGEL